MPLTANQIVEWQNAKKELLLPIVYLRGFAMTEGEIDDTTADPFNGFNVGSVLLRTGWTGDSARHIFESPVLRLTQPPYRYRLVFSEGVRGLSPEAKNELAEWAALPSADGGASASTSKAVIAIYRYYDIDSHMFGEGTNAGMATYGWGLGRLVIDVLNATQADGVFLVAHSMGGLVARTFLQNDRVLDGTHSPRGAKEFDAVQSLIDAKRVDQLTQADWDRARRAVRRFFTYGTPHKGITGQGGRGNGLLGAIGALVGFQIDNFDQDNIKKYLGGATEANSLDGKFGVENTFCLIGTGSADYPVAGGLSRRLVGQLSDGLVEIDNAYVWGPKTGGSANDGPALAARAYVRRAHSGPYGMVNSEEGFGNLARFLFGDVRIDGDLKVRTLELPSAVAKMQAEGRKIRASYSFESFLRVRGENWAMNERLARDGAAIFRRYDELFPDMPATAGLNLTSEQEKKKRLHRKVELFTAFLDTHRRTDPKREEAIKGGRKIKGTMGFALRLRIAVPDYEVDGRLWRKDHYEGSSLLDQDLAFLAFRDESGSWGLAWGANHADTSNLAVVEPAADTAAAKSNGIAFSAEKDGAVQFWLPLLEEGPPRVQAWLRLKARPHLLPKP